MRGADGNWALSKESTSVRQIRTLKTHYRAARRCVKVTALCTKHASFDEATHNLEPNFET